MPDENGEWTDGDPWTPAMYRTYSALLAERRAQQKKESIQASLAGSGIALALLGLALLVAWSLGDLHFH